MKMISPTMLEKGLALPVMEDFYTLQGEGFHTGQAAYFLRIGGCDVGCRWCDVKESWNASKWPLTQTDDIIKKIIECPAKNLVVTGGEPLMYQLDYLSKTVRKSGFKTYLETSGAYPLSGHWDWICLSPKKQTPPLEKIFQFANELKVIIQKKEDFKWAEENAKKVSADCHLFLQPEWSRYSEMAPVIVDYIQKNPHWKVSLQSHKYLKIP